MTGKQVLATRNVNAQIRNAASDFGLLYVIPEGTLPRCRCPSMAATGRLMRRMLDGRWVGGRVSLTDAELRFVPHALSRLLHADDGSVAIPLDELTRVGRGDGRRARIIEMETAWGSLAICCDGAEALAGQIRVAAAGARRPLAPADLD